MSAEQSSVTINISETLLSVGGSWDSYRVINENSRRGGRTPAKEHTWPYRPADWGKRWVSARTIHRVYAWLLYFRLTIGSVKRVKAGNLRTVLSKIKTSIRYCCSKTTKLSIPKINQIKLVWYSFRGYWKLPSNVSQFVDLWSHQGFTNCQHQDSLTACASKLVTKPRVVRSNNKYEARVWAATAEIIVHYDYAEGDREKVLQTVGLVYSVV